MLVRTHRAFGLAASTTGLCLLQRYAPQYMPISNDVTGYLQLAVAEAAVLLSSAWPEVDKVLGTEHRGITHAIWIPLGFLAGAIYLHTTGNVVLGSYGAALLLGLALGYFFHLFGDAFSIAGVAWFYPIQQYERFANGAFYVKGFRGPFVPLYRVGNRAFCFMPIVWWLMAIGANILLWGRLVTIL